MQHIMFLISALYPLVLESTICLVCQQAFISLAPSLQRSLKPRMFMRSGQMWPVAAGVTRCGQSWLLHLLCPCRFAAIACRPLADPLHIPAAPLPFLSRPLQVSCMSLGYSLGLPLALVLQFPCGSPAGALQGIEDPLQAGLPQARSPLAVSLRIPCRSPDPCRSLAGISQIYSDPSSGFPRFPRTSHGDSLQVPLRFPCSSPAGFLQFSCRAPAGPLQIPCRSSLAASLQLACSAPAGPLL